VFSETYTGAQREHNKSFCGKNLGVVMGKVKVDLGGKVAFVTGGSKRIGRSISLALAESGTRVAVTSRTFAVLDLLKKEIEEKNIPSFIKT